MSCHGTKSLPEQTMCYYRSAGGSWESYRYPLRLPDWTGSVSSQALRKDLSAGSYELAVARIAATLQGGKPMTSRPLLGSVGRGSPVVCRSSTHALHLILVEEVKCGRAGCERREGHVAARQ